MKKINYWFLIMALYMSTFLCLVDLSSVNLALKSIQIQFDSNMADLQWVVDSYALTMASLMLAVGALSQRIGRKRLWLIAVVIFILGSLLCAIASSFFLLIIGRIIQGIAGAVLIPIALAIIVDHFPDVDGKAREIGRWSSFSAFALIIGPLMGGLMVHYLGWQSIFWLNLPVGVLTLVLGWKGIHQDQDTHAVSFDYLGLIYTALAVASLTYSIIMLQQIHVGYRVLLGFVVFIVATLTYIWHQQRIHHPLIPHHLFQNVAFLRYNLISFLLGFAGYSSLFVFALFYQEQVHLTAAQAGWLIAPQFVAQAIVSIFFGRLQKTYTMTFLLRIGLLISGCAFVAMMSFQPSSSYWLFIILGGLMGAGIGLVVPASSALTMGCVSPHDANFAAAILNAMRQLGMTLGIAVLGTVMMLSIQWSTLYLGYQPVESALFGFHIVICVMGGLFILMASRFVKT